MESLLRFLDVVREEFGAADARAEVGGSPPRGAGLVWVSLQQEWRIVLTFDTPPDDSEAIRARLAARIEVFEGPKDALASHLPSVRPVSSHDLNEVLAGLVVKGAACCAVVIDEHSPVVWGCSESLWRDLDVGVATRAERLRRRASGLGMDATRLLAGEEEFFTASTKEAMKYLRDAAAEVRGRVEEPTPNWRAFVGTARAIADVRGADEGEEGLRARLVEHDDGYGLVVRTFGSIYRLLLVFDNTFSELHAESAMLHALPVIERLVLALPPIDPDGVRGARKKPDLRAV